MSFISQYVQQRTISKQRIYFGLIGGLCLIITLLKHIIYTHIESIFWRKENTLTVLYGIGNDTGTQNNLYRATSTHENLIASTVRYIHDNNSDNSAIPNTPNYMLVHNNTVPVYNEYTLDVGYTYSNLIYEVTNATEYKSKKMYPKTVSEPHHNNNICRLYMAPSTISGAGFGLFAGTTFQVGDLVTPGDGVVPLYDMVYYNGNDDHENTFLWDEYVWSGSTFTGMEENGRTVEAASFGIGALPNCFFPLINVEDSVSHGRDNANLEEYDSPGIGAFTPWYDRKSHATRTIHVGSELFVDYGYAYFRGSRAEIIGHVPFLYHYEIADSILNKFLNISDRITSKIHSIENTQLVMMEDFFQMTRNILGIWPNRILHALPKNSTSIPKVLKYGGTAKKDYLKSIRTKEYLYEYGACMDHLFVQTSKLIPNAGRGVFTNISFQQGSVVTTIPLIHVPERRVLTIYAEAKYDATGSHLEIQRNESQPIHQQLFLNYCFGHNQSTLLLCPYGIVSSLINHAPMLQNNESSHQNQTRRQTANLRIQWSKKFTKSQEWWNMSITDWAYTYRTGLAFEYIALRDITAGEELFIDYGIEWQIAWDKHVSYWKPTQKLIDNLNMDIDSIIPTEEEWIWNVGDINQDANAVNLWCYNIYRLIQGLDAVEDEAFPCKVVHRLFDPKSLSYVYTAELFIRRHNGDNDTCDEVFDEVLWLLPRDAFVYGGFYENYDTRQYVSPITFRHDMRIPDDVMPNIWKNS